MWVTGPVANGSRISTLTGNTPGYFYEDSRHFPFSRNKRMEIDFYVSLRLCVSEGNIREVIKNAIRCDPAGSLW